MYGYKVNRNDQFTLDEFIAACEAPLPPELSTYKQWEEKALAMSDEELKDAYDKETCENIIGLRRRLEFDKTVMTAEEFEAFNARFLRLKDCKKFCVN